MSFDDELERRLTERANAEVAAPDLAAVESAAGGRRSRRRRAIAVGTVAATGLAVVAVLVASGTRPQPDEPTSAGVAATSDPTSTDAPPGSGGPPPTDSASVAPATSAADDASSQVVAPTPATSPGSAPSDQAAKPDLIQPYLDRTTEIYRRSVGERQIIVRRSDASWEEFFDLEWRAPTGSAELCMGDHALLVGDTASTSPFEHMWEPIDLFVDIESHLTVEQSWYGDFAVVRTSDGADEVVLLDGDGDEADRAPLQDGLAVLIMTGVWGTEADPGEPSVMLVADGVPGDPVPFGEAVGVRYDHLSADCSPPPFPTLPLPPPGAQPADPVAAEAEIRARHALVVDRSVTLDEDPPGLLDDYTGIAEATAEVDGGQYADAAASAVHTIEALVFTAPDEAWFEYTIATSTGDLTGRFGVARFNGDVWQITRATVCQDLGAAGGQCEPSFTVQTPPQPEGWNDVLAEFERTLELYFEHRNCLPPPFDGGWCLEDDPEQVTLSGDGG